MIIGIDASRANELKKTGTEWYAYHLIQNFKKIADSKDQFILYTKEPLRGDLGKLPSHFQNRVLRWPPKFLWTQIRLSWEMLIRKPDILFVPAHTIPLIHPKKNVTTLHDVGFERFQELYSKEKIGYKAVPVKWLINTLIRILTLGKYGSSEYDYHRFSARFALKHAGKIFTISQFSKQEILDIYGKTGEEKISVIPLAYDRESFLKEPDQQSIQNILNKYKIQKPFLLFIGRLEEKKNTPGLIEAFRILQKKYSFRGQLVLLGNPGFHFDQVLKKIERYGLDQKVIRPGWVSEEERLLFLKAATVFVFPSFYEGFGIPPLEAMASGTPVVASWAASIPEVVGEAAFLVNPYNPEEIAKGVNNILTNKNLKEKLVERGSEQIKKFSWEKTAKKTLEEIKNEGSKANP